MTAGDWYRPPIVVTDEDRAMAQAYIKWASVAYPPGGDERGQEWWDAIAAAFVAGWRAQSSGPSPGGEPVTGRALYSPHRVLWIADRRDTLAQPYGNPPVAVCHAPKG